MSDKKMAAILASPRKNGNVDKMLQIAVREGEKKGYEVTCINVYEQKIAPCLGCMACKKTGECVIQDDMVKISKEIQESDLVVISAPTYFANVPGVLKNMFDRLGDRALAASMP